MTHYDPVTPEERERWRRAELAHAEERKDHYVRAGRKIVNYVRGCETPLTSADIIGAVERENPGLWEVRAAFWSLVDSGRLHWRVDDRIVLGGSWETPLERPVW